MVVTRPLLLLCLLATLGIARADEAAGFTVGQEHDMLCVTGAFTANEVFYNIGGRNNWICPTVITEAGCAAYEARNGQMNWRSFALDNVGIVLQWILSLITPDKGK